MLFGEAANDWSCELFWGGGDTPMRDTPEARAGRGRLPNWGRALGAYFPTPSCAGPAAVVAPPPGLRCSPLILRKPAPTKTTRSIAIAAEGTAGARSEGR